MIARAFTAALAAAALSLASAAPAAAQVVGTFSWQTQPYCNVITVTVIQQGAAFQLTGLDNQCGGAASPVTGTAIFSGGTVQMGIAVALANGRAVNLSTSISLGTLSGTWTDDASLAGTFVFNGSGAGGGVRPAPSTVRTDTYFPQAVTWEQPSLFVSSFINECVHNTTANSVFALIPIMMPAGSRLLSVDTMVLDGAGPTTYSVAVRKITYSPSGVSGANVFSSGTLGAGSGFVHAVYTPATPEISTPQTNYYVRVGGFGNSANGFCSVTVTYDPHP